MTNILPVRPSSQPASGNTPPRYDPPAPETPDPAPTPRSVSTPPPAERHHTARHEPKKAKRHHFLIGAVLLVALLVFLAMSLFRSNAGPSIDGNKYQAVFFTNGQVYFGKLQSVNDKYMKLTNIYYLQAPAADNSKNPQETTSASDVQLIKLGNEVHGPDDEMIINNDQILFFENLKKDGKVSTTIAKDQTKK